MKVLIRFTKDRNLRWISHLDLLKVLEKALRRANLPMALSQGFNPRPKMSIASPLPVGVSSEGEYLELELTEEMPLEEVKDRFNCELPVGLKVLEIALLPDKSRAIMASVYASKYIITISKLPLFEKPMEEILQTLQEKPEIWIHYRSKDGKEKKQDIKPGFLSCRWVEESSQFFMKLETNSKTFIRPQHVLQAIAMEAGVPERDFEEVEIHRVEIILNQNIDKT